MRIHWQLHYVVVVVVVFADVMSAAMEMNSTDLFFFDDGTPFDNYWYKTLIITLYSIVCVGCIVGKCILQSSGEVKVVHDKEPKTVTVKL